MSDLHYHSGELVMVGDRVKLAADEGRILHLDDALKDWGLSEEERKGKVMIECRTMGLICESANSEDLFFISRNDENMKSEKK